MQDQKGSEPCVELRMAACGCWEIPGVSSKEQRLAPGPRVKAASPGEHGDPGVAHRDLLSAGQAWRSAQQ